MRTLRNSKCFVPQYAGSLDLHVVILEIHRNVDEALDALAMGKSALSPDLLDNIRCVVEDVEEKLKPHYDALADLDDARSVAAKKRKQARSPRRE